MTADLVMDIGAHVGNDSAHYLSEGFRVVGVEANPDLCAKLRNRFSSEIRSGKFELVEAAIGERAGELDFWVNGKDSQWSSVIQDVGERGGSSHRIRVRAVTFSELTRSFGVPYYAKIDIEGADVYCLRNLPVAGTPKYLSVEANELEYLFLLRSAGYDSFKCIDQMSHNDRRIPRFTRLRRTMGKVERRMHQMRFPVGSSGPMSHETLGRWQTLEQVAYEWLHHHFGIQRRTHLYCRSWLDFHATTAPS